MNPKFGPMKTGLSCFAKGGTPRVWPMRFTGLALLASLLACFGGCAVNPVTGKKTVSLMSESQEIALGRQSDPSIVAEYGLFQHEGLQQLIDARGKEMGAISHRPHLNYTFRILDSPVVNAFALPGGYVYFTRGILAHFNNEAELAGVLGHEIGHITARHADEQYTRQVFSQALLFGGMMLSKELRTFSRETQAAMALLFLKYSRDNETQSDGLGVEYSTRIGYDAREMSKFFNTLKALSDDHGSLPDFLSTHPDPGNRVVRVAQLAGEWQARDQRAPYKVNQDSYLRLLDGLIYGEDPRQGYVDRNVFYHPELKFQFTYPQGWILENSPTQVVMVPEDKSALVLFTLAQGASLRDAAEKALKAYELQADASRQLTINNLPALLVDSRQVQQDPSTGATTTIQVRSTFIQYDGRYFVFHGVANGNRFGYWLPAFESCGRSFSRLSDPARINVRPEVIRVVQARSSGTFGQVLDANGIPSTRRREMEILNQLGAGDPVAAGQLIKIVGRQ